MVLVDTEVIVNCECGADICNGHMKLRTLSDGSAELLPMNGLVLKPSGKLTLVAALYGVSLEHPDWREQLATKLVAAMEDMP